MADFLPCRELAATNQLPNPGVDNVKPQWAHLNQFNEQPAEMQHSDFRDIDCLINEEYSVACRKEADEVFIPFSFIEKYFEVSVAQRENEVSIGVGCIMDAVGDTTAKEGKKQKRRNQL